jgi:hypothetical protein
MGCLAGGLFALVLQSREDLTRSTSAKPALTDAAYLSLLNFGSSVERIWRMLITLTSTSLRYRVRDCQVPREPQSGPRIGIRGDQGRELALAQEIAWADVATLDPLSDKPQALIDQVLHQTNWGHAVWVDRR